MIRNYLRIGQIARTAAAASCRSSLADLVRPQRSNLGLPVPTWAQHAAVREFRNTPRILGDGDKVEVNMGYAGTMPKKMRDFPNDVLIMVTCQEGDRQHEACAERLVREIMCIDEVEWEEAQPRLQEMREANKKNRGILTLPYSVGITAAVTAAFSSIFLVFDLDTALIFNEKFVTTDVADPEDLETFLEVGAWTWNWMEPPLGQISFFLLCLQYSRAQLQNLGIKPYTAWLLKKRAARLVALYPQYDSEIVSHFSETDSIW
mmetsp:Transcript_37153/g.80885  ORF Transcript_37153/g.80885 Transcript_37153/m.80885 type:complete len:262 (+) Transcript_37153:71-856(+)|eukprot:CAMPEP_0118932032 /NCGR_PEP_ID=MMETSP1169-20130426/8950_1 /TAXON_ID=36882 /ORGANISM="Pyramimonas obovata, Strain CCMP722" /LENGTH=261 /DNA_ID=CAMNT_0006874621 /DNA_START=57 /DNA_END=842 /DNA_ORIENTATION=-